MQQDRNANESGMVTGKETVEKRDGTRSGMINGWVCEEEMERMNGLRQKLAFGSAGQIAFALAF